MLLIVGLMMTVGSTNAFIATNRIAGIAELHASTVNRMVACVVTQVSVENVYLLRTEFCLLKSINLF